MISGDLGTATGRSDLVRLALRLIVEEALEGEVSDAVGRERYERAERYLRWNVPRLVSRTDVHPRWTGSGSHLWYRVRTTDGWETVLVDPHRRTRGPAVDHDRLAEHFGAAEMLEIVGVVVNMNIWSRLKLAQGAMPEFDGEEGYPIR